MLVGLDAGCSTIHAASADGSSAFASERCRAGMSQPAHRHTFFVAHAVALGTTPPMLQPIPAAEATAAAAASTASTAAAAAAAATAWAMAGAAAFHLSALLPNLPAAAGWRGQRKQPQRLTMVLPPPLRSSRGTTRMSRRPLPSRCRPWCAHMSVCDQLAAAMLIRVFWAVLLSNDNAACK